MSNLRFWNFAADTDCTIGGGRGRQNAEGKTRGSRKMDALCFLRTPQECSLLKKSYKWCRLRKKVQYMAEYRDIFANTKLVLYFQPVIFAVSCWRTRQLTSERDNSFCYNYLFNTWKKKNSFTIQSHKPYLIAFYSWTQNIWCSDLSLSIRRSRFQHCFWSCPSILNFLLSKINLTSKNPL